MTKKVIDIMLWEEGFYPFSLKYNLEEAIKKHASELDSFEMDETAHSILKYSNYFNRYFQEICMGLNKIITKSKLEKELFINLLIADLNRTELLVSVDTKKEYKSNGSLDIDSLSNTYLSKPEFQNRKEPAWGLIDAAIDTANLNLNYLNYVKFKNPQEIDNELLQVEVLKNLSIIGSSFNVIKQAYDKIIWRNYSIQDKDSIIYLKSNHVHLMLDNAALTRLSRNIGSTFFELVNKSPKYKDIFKLYHQTRKFQKIASVDITNNRLTIKYGSKTNKPSDSFLGFVAPLLTYYPFYRSKEIISLCNLTLLDLVNLFSILHDLVELMPIPEYEDTGVQDLEKFKQFNPMIKKTDLFIYFKKTTKYTESQINQFLHLLTQKTDKHNLYQFPIYEFENNYFFAQSTIKRANMLFLIDRWLNAGNCDLSERGHKFEEYIKSFLNNEKMNDYAQFSLISRSEFSFIDNNGKRQNEEIDIVIKTENKIIIGEVKCTTYPLESNDFYNSFQIIKKAKDQVKRKANFIRNHWDKFENELGPCNKREIEQIIILNFPHFTGRVIEDVPITDFYLFLSYFKSGELTNVKIERGKNPQIESKPYYDSIDSFERNFGDFFRKPIPITELVSRQSIEEYEVTLKGTEPKTVAERVVYEPRGRN
ncbi:hypothetical protein K6119_01750 [Paracrocinitomix mangrovi]|uniref:hypothetical protein n=1 Tax=Paracrocinitomix mangrovi TaxID=2862509 RepID=UPI001C8E8856|nr:hypothetical protein [Paracrocinitomix mangrovi]UKN02241.1 hypothetical protein K6119_01750 [Paracrocinitomix mangrovi]